MSADSMIFTDWIRYDLAEYLNIPANKLYFFWDRHRLESSNNYTVVQGETLSIPGKVDQSYINLLSNASVIYDFTEKNISEYPLYFPDNVCKKVKHLHYKPSKDSVYNDTVEKTIDVLWYGWQSPRRLKIIQKIQEDNPNWVIRRPSEDQMIKSQQLDLISKSRWVLSVGSWDNCPSDAFRTTPALNYGANILTEYFHEPSYMDYLTQHFSDRIKILKKQYFND